MIIRDRTARVRGEADGVRYSGADPVFKHRCDSALVAQVVAYRRMREDETNADAVRAAP